MVKTELAVQHIVLSRMWKWEVSQTPLFLVNKLSHLNLVFAGVFGMLPIGLIV